MTFCLALSKPFGIFGRTAGPKLSFPKYGRSPNVSWDINKCQIILTLTDEENASVLGNLKNNIQDVKFGST